MSAGVVSTTGPSDSSSTSLTMTLIIHVHAGRKLQHPWVRVRVSGAVTQLAARASRFNNVILVVHVMDDVTRGVAAPVVDHRELLLIVMMIVIIIMKTMVRWLKISFSIG